MSCHGWSSFNTLTGQQTHGINIKLTRFGAKGFTLATVRDRHKTNKQKSKRRPLLNKMECSLREFSFPTGGFDNLCTAAVFVNQGKGICRTTWEGKNKKVVTPSTKRTKWIDPDRPKLYSFSGFNESTVSGALGDWELASPLSC